MILEVLSQIDLLKCIFYHKTSFFENLLKYVTLSDYFTCANGVMVPASHVCDGLWDCGDASDEDATHAGCESMCHIIVDHCMVLGLVCNPGSISLDTFWQ